MPLSVVWGLAGVAPIVGASFAISGQATVAWVVIGIAAVAFVLAVWASFQTVIDAAAARAEPGQAQALARLSDLDQRSKDLARRIGSLHKQVKQLPHVSVELARRHDQLIDDDLPMPTLGSDWAVTAPTLLFLVDEVLGNGRRRVLECGSGASTVWVAAALRRRGDGHVRSLEADKRFADRTRQTLRAHGLERWATVIDAPMVEQDTPALGAQPWYDIHGLGEADAFDLLFVDGPPGSTGKLARYPAVPRLLARLSPEATVVIDDTNRGAERRIVNMWSADGAFDRRVSVVKDVGQSTVLRIE